MLRYNDDLVAALVTDPDEDMLALLSATHTVDAVTAVARGLAEYLSTAVSQIGQRETQFADVTVQWGLPNDPCAFPGLVVAVTEPAREEDPTLSQGAEYLGETLGIIRRPAQLTQNLSVLVWATDPVSRSAMYDAVVQMLYPVEYSTGFKLELPYYYGSYGTYTFLESSFQDSAEKAAKGEYIAEIKVQSEVEQFTGPTVVDVGDVIGEFTIGEDITLVEEASE
jgi:hypothetical protein